MTGSAYSVYACVLAYIGLLLSRVASKAGATGAAMMLAFLSLVGFIAGLIVLTVAEA